MNRERKPPFLTAALIASMTFSLGAPAPGGKKLKAKLVTSGLRRPLASSERQE